jgi:hypothetical protein
LVQSITKDNVDHAGLGVQLKLLKDYMKLMVINTLKCQFNKLLIAVNTLELKDATEVGLNGFMNM